MTNHTTSGTTDFQSSRDEVINRALRIIGAIGQGETGTATQLSEAATALNHLTKEWNTDGMPLWKIKTYTAATLTQGTGSYTIGTGSTIAQVAPLKVLHAFLRDASASRDIPLVLITKNQYDMLGDKTSQGYVSQLFYNPPGANVKGTANEMEGTIFMLMIPNAYVAANQTLILIGQTSFEDFSAATDVPDFPSYFVNALSWGLADQLCYEYGVAFAERSMIAKKAMEHKMLALGFGTEEGSLFIQPNTQLMNQFNRGGY